MPEHLDQQIGITRMEPDTRLVQYIKRPDQATPQRGRQIDTLAFSSGKRGRQAVKRQITQPHIQQEFQAGTYLLQNLGGNRFLFICQELIYFHQPVIQLVDVHIREFIDVFVMDTEMKRLLIQLRPLTFRTNRSFSELFRPFLSSGRSVFLLQHLDILHNSFIRYKIVGRSTYQ